MTIPLEDSATTRRRGTVALPGVDLYYEARGSGPLLLISESGEGDAGRSAMLADRLARHYTVVTYDRRGLSRSVPLDDRPVTMETHARDAVGVIDAVRSTGTDRSAAEPAVMLGCSIGAVIGLHVAVQHPDRLAALIVHEPVAPWLLPDHEAAAHRAELQHCQDVFHEQGWRAALAPMAETLGIDPANQQTEPDAVLPALDDQRARNFSRFLGVDFSAIAADRLDPATLRETPVRILPAAGALTPTTVFDRRCAEHLARLRNEQLLEFPGGHNGNMTHPSAYADAVLAALGRAEGTRSTVNIH
ncbi:alpha/beta hydrolase [Microbacterium kyungheense]|uniref:alpha/beta fold hydrolase n=1 Tax=Microbacterium kyungheense TaxID=1263636 RepID=UPI0031EE0CF6